MSAYCVGVGELMRNVIISAAIWLCGDAKLASAVYPIGRGTDDEHEALIAISPQLRTKEQM